MSGYNLWLTADEYIGIATNCWCMSACHLRPLRPICDNLYPSWDVCTYRGIGTDCWYVVVCHLHPLRPVWNNMYPSSDVWVQSAINCRWVQPRLTEGECLSVICDFICHLQFLVQYMYFTTPKLSAQSPLWDVCFWQINWKRWQI